MSVKLFLSILSFLTVSLTAPSAGTIQSGSNATVTASVTDPNTGATITGVNFYAGTNFIGSSTASPYTITWAQPVDGTYSLTATAIDSFDATGTSSGVSVTVGTPIPVQAFANACSSTPQTLSGTLSVNDGTSPFWGPQHYANDFTFQATSAPEWVVISQQSTALDSLATLYDDTFTTTITTASSATPIVVTDTANGLYNGEAVTIAGVSSNANANGAHYAGSVAANAFSLYTTSGLGTPVGGSGSGTGGTATSAGQTSYTDLVIDSSGSTSTISSSAKPFPTVYANQILVITGGTGFTPGAYLITSVNSSTHVATVSGNLGTNGSTSGVGSVSVLAYNDDSQGVPPDSQIVYELPSMGTYTIEASSAAPYQTGPFTVTLTCPGSTPSATLLLNTPGSTIGSLEPVTSSSGGSCSGHTIDMGDAIPAGVLVTETLTLQNSGTEDAAITSASTTGTGFSISAPPQIVKAGTQVTFTISFIGSASETGTLTIANTSGTNPYTVCLSATVDSTLGPPVATTNGLTLSPSTQVGGSSVSATVTLAGVPTSDQAVSLASADPSLVKFPNGLGTYSVTVPAGTNPPQETVTLTTAAVSAGQEPTIAIEASTPANTSGPVVANLTLLPPQGTAPTVTLATPTGNPSAITTSPLVFGQGTVISLVATASAAGSAHIAYVQYYGSVGGGAATLLGQQDEGVVSGGTTTYSFVWPGAVNGSWSVYAVATDTNGHASSDSSAQTFTVEYFPRAATPTFTPSSGTYTGWVPISSIGDSTSGASIYYTVDGSDPTSSSTRMLYGGSAFKLFSGTLKAVAVESGYLTSYVGTATFTVNTTGVSGGLTVALSGPTDGSEITSPTTVSGSVTPLSGVSTYWQITCSIDGGNGSPIVLNSGTITSSTSVSANMDTTLMLDGQYSITLSAIDTNGNSASQSVTVVVKGHEKIGYFTLSYTDMTIPIGGMPISIIRTYDSRDKSAGDFGVGWKLSTTNATAAKSDGVDGFNWNYTFSLLTYQYVPAKPHFVTITLPGDDVYNFVMTLSPDGQSFEPLENSSVIYQEVSGHYASLSPVGDGGDPNVLLENTSSDGDPNNGSANEVELMEPDGVTPYDPTEFVLTLHNGTQYDIAVSGGLQSITDRNGNTVFFGSSGIQDQSDSRSITFTRSSSGQITGITDMMGNTFSYVQDANGNLSSATDRVGNTTTYGYDSNHDVTSIHAPDGSQPIENVYYPDGRLEDTENALSHTVNYYYNSAVESASGANDVGLSYLETVPSGAEVTVDPLGNPTVAYYDSLGNVTEKTQYLTDATHTNTPVTWHYTFGDSANPDKATEQIDPMGNETDFKYDAEGNQQWTKQYLTDATHSGTTVMTSAAYNAYGEETSETDANGNVTIKSGFDGNGNLLSLADAVGNVTTFVHNNDGTLASSTNSTGNTLGYSYNSAGNITGILDGLGHTSSFAFDPDGNATESSAARTNVLTGTPISVVTQGSYDDSDRLVKTTLPDGSTQQTVYNADGEVDHTIDPVGRTTYYKYDSTGRKIQTIYPDGSTTKTTYDANGNDILDYDATGRVTGHVYNTLNRLIEIGPANPTTPISSGVVQFELDSSSKPIYTTTTYNLNGQTTGTTDENSNTSTSVYDTLGRVLSTEDAIGNVTTNAYDLDGNLLSTTDPNGNTTAFSYNADNDEILTSYPGGATSSTEYDGEGHVTSETDQMGRTTQYGYDVLGRLADVIDPLGYMTRYNYDEMGACVERTDANGHVTKSGYDASGRLVEKVLPLGQTVTLAYNPDGTINSTTDYNGKTVDYGYDSAGRENSVTYADGSSSSIVYNADGTRYTAQMTPASGPVVTLQYTYDPDRELMDSVKETVGSIYNTVSYGYDDAGNRAYVQSPYGETQYSYDQDNRLSTMTSTDSAISNFYYDHDGDPLTTVYPNGLHVTYAYNVLDELTSVITANSSAQLISDTYNLNADGQRMSVTDSANGTTNYGYDRDGRLTSEVGSAVNNTYVYDAVGNRTSLNSTNYTFDTNDRNEAFTYDSNGNATVNGSLDLGYDELNRTTSAGTTSYAYDIDGNRVQSTVGGTVTNYVVDPNSDLPEVVEERNSSNASVAHYEYGNGLERMDRSGTSYYLFDGVGNVRGLASSSGSVTDTYAFDAYGNQLSHTGSTTNPYRYNAQALDADGFYYLRHRYYDPTGGRFTSQDPLTESMMDPLSINRYVYAGDDPVNNHDPAGESFLSQLYTQFQGYEVEAAVEEQYLSDLDPNQADVTFGGWQYYLPNGAGWEPKSMGQANKSRYRKPDIFNFQDFNSYVRTGPFQPCFTFNEIKPLTPSGVKGGRRQIRQDGRAYGWPNQYAKTGFVPFITWVPPVQPLIGSLTGTQYWIVNVAGLLLYTNVRSVDTQSNELIDALTLGLVASVGGGATSATGSIAGTGVGAATAQLLASEADPVLEQITEDAPAEAEAAVGVETATVGVAADLEATAGIAALDDMMGD